MKNMLKEAALKDACKTFRWMWQYNRFVCKRGGEPLLKGRDEHDIFRLMHDIESGELNADNWKCNNWEALGLYAHCVCCKPTIWFLNGFRKVCRWFEKREELKKERGAE